MNKYLLIISAMTAFGGVSNMFSQDKSSYKKDSVALFMDDLHDRHDGKMTLASGLAIADFICRPLIFASNLPKKQMVHAFNHRVGAPLWLATGLATYSVGETLHYRSKQ